MPRILGLVTLLLTLAATPGTRQAPASHGIQSPPESNTSPRLVIHGWVAEMTLPPSPAASRKPGPIDATVKFRFRNLYDTNEVGLPITESRGVEMLCEGISDARLTIPKPGGHVTLYAVPSFPSFWRCDTHEWLLAGDTTCGSPGCGDWPMLCTPSSDQCTRIGGNPDRSVDFQPVSYLPEQSTPVESRRVSQPKRSAQPQSDEPPEAEEDASPPPPRLVVEARLAELRTWKPRGETHESARPLAGLRFRSTRWEPVEDQPAIRSSTGDELICVGSFEFEMEQLRSGDLACLYTTPKNSDFELCEPRRWQLAREAHCATPADDDWPLVCTPSGGPCPKKKLKQPLETTNPAVPAALQPDAAAVSAANAALELDMLDAVGGYLQVGEVLVGRKHRARAEGDINGDGLPDLAIAPAGVLTVEVYLAKPNTRPELVSRIELERSICDLQIRDFGVGPHADVRVTYCTTPDHPRADRTILVGDGTGNFVRK